MNNNLVRLCVSIATVSLFSLTWTNDKKPYWDKTEERGCLQRSERTTPSGREVLYVVAGKTTKNQTYWVCVSQHTDNKGQATYTGGTYYARCANTELNAFDRPENAFLEYDQQWDDTPPASCCAVS